MECIDCLLDIFQSAFSGDYFRVQGGFVVADPPCFSLRSLAPLLEIVS